MTDFEIQIGKAYIKQKRDTILLVKIIGEVEPDTYEYTEGKRYFYDDRGMVFTDTGVEIIYHKPGQKSPQVRWKLIREATTEDAANGFSEIIHYSREQCSNKTMFISTDDPNFKMKLGSVYVTRMGLVRLVDKIYHSPNHEETLIFTSGDNQAWNEKGRVNPKFKSIKDVIFQRI